jgi:hypothetical protein
MLTAEESANQIAGGLNPEPLPFNRLWLVQAIAAAIRDAEAAAEARGRAAEREEILGLLDRYWRFDGSQQHTHSWHDWADCLEAIRARGSVQHGPPS